MSRPRIIIRPVAAIGRHEGIGFVTRVDGCGVRPVTLPTYPPSPNGARLRDARVNADLTLREWAEVLGVSALEAGGLERGSHTVDDWDAVFAILDGASSR